MSHAPQPASTDPFSACTTHHCTWGELGHMYFTAPFLAGLAACVVVAALFLSPRTRRFGWAGVAVLVVAGLIGMHRGGAS
jgi:drug/metabolite transporter (DMT)-like permease